MQFSVQEGSLDFIMPLCPTSEGDVKIGSIIQPELVLPGVKKNLSIADCMSNKQGCPPPYVCLFPQSVEQSASP